MDHPFADRWNHNTHYYPLLRSLLPKSGRVLDVGCGDGTFGRYVADPRRAVVGVDLDAAVLPRDGGVACAGATALPFADATFDAVTMVAVLHHVEAAEALAEAARVLVPGGALVVLGIGRSGVRDLPYELRDVVAHRLTRRGKHAWEPPTVKADPPLGWAETRAQFAAALPGCTHRRLPMWRYVAEWRRPVTG